MLELFSPLNKTIKQKVKNNNNTLNIILFLLFFTFFFYFSYDLLYKLSNPPITINMVEIQIQIINGLT